jgi:hypothetical protein
MQKVLAVGDRAAHVLIGGAVKLIIKKKVAWACILVPYSSSSSTILLSIMGEKYGRSLCWWYQRGSNLLLLPAGLFFLCKPTIRACWAGFRRRLPSDSGLRK